MNSRVRKRVDEDAKYMNPRVRQRVEDVVPKVQESLDWTSMSYDLTLHVFTLLDNRDRASLASTCKAWRSIGASAYLWSSLDLRAYRFTLSVAASLANRCADLQKVRFRGLHSPAAMVNLKAKKLREISGEGCENVTDAKLSMIIARHEALEVLQLGPGFGERITSEAINIIAICCPKLKTLRVSGMRNVSSDAILSLSEHCPQLTDVGFLDCLHIHEVALGEVVSLRYIAVTGTSNINWRIAAESWEKLPNLTGLDVSRTSIDHVAVSRLLTSSQSLKVVCALNCPLLDNVADFDPDRFGGKLLIAMFNNTLNGMTSLFEDNSKMLKEETMHWLEWSLSRMLLNFAENNLLGLNSFWQSHGAKLFIRLMQSTQEDVQERSTTGLAAFMHVGDEAGKSAEAVMRDGGIPVLLKLAKSLNEGFQSEAAKAIVTLSLNPDTAKAVAEEGGVNVLLGLAKSKNRLVAQEAAEGLWNLSLGDAYKAIAEAGGVNVLMELLSRWSYGYGRLMERAAGAIANLAGDDKCSMEVARAGGVHALVGLARDCTYEGAKAQAARGLANLASYDDSNINNASIGQEPDALETLLMLTRSHHGGVKQEAAGALWRLAYDEKNRELIASLGGVEALVELARSCIHEPWVLQESAAGALWGLAHSDEQSTEIGKQGGIPPLIALGKFNAGGVHENVAGALWTLSFNHGNAVRIVEDRGVQMLVRICTYSASKLARFLASLALAYIFDGSLDDRPKRTSKSVCSAKVRTSALKCIESFIKNFKVPQIFASAASSTTPSMLAQVSEKLRIPGADNLRCSGEEIGRIVTMLQNLLLNSKILQPLRFFSSQYRKLVMLSIMQA
ncbi:Protein ARABIDILLO 2 [Raphanus sativus]|nr:Protein ARABIDILLO 2 [Raphanus sativus]